MRVPGIKRVKQSARWLRSRFVPGALILGYHRIADAPDDPLGLCVSSRHFAEQLEVLRKYTNPISLRELIRALVEGTLPKRAVVVTFDDGYADNLYAARPLLEQHHVPATVFVATGNLGREFWWDELANIVFTAEMLPTQLHLSINRATYEWEANGFAYGAESKQSGTHQRRQLLLSLV
jgi:peptidoglycan/xylan/chitin deacetylase (PgdA/CDA1 family)